MFEEKKEGKIGHLKMAVPSAVILHSANIAFAECLVLAVSEDMVCRVP